MFRQKGEGEQGFTLVELMIVVVIIGILCALAIPRVLATTAYTKQSEAKLVLKEIYEQQRVYYQRWDSYWIPAGGAANAANQLTFVDLGVTIQPTARYTYTITGDRTSFVATAVCGVLDDDPTIDEWQITSSGDLVAVNDDAKS